MNFKIVPNTLVAAATALALSACAQTTAEAPALASVPVVETGPNDPDYTAASNWLCLPDRDDACAIDLDAAVIEPDGTILVEEYEPATDPAFDCFYVYPTVSQDQSTNSDMVAGEEELSVVAAQFARFGSQCRTFAPLYRQVTVATLRKVMAQAQQSPGNASLAQEPRDAAFADVKRAWAEYLANHNDGRGVILIGHSQGADMLKRLVAQEIEGKPIADRMIAAYLIGFNVMVPEGETVGGEFKSTPLCTSGDQTSCIVAYSSFAQATAPGAASLFGRSYAEGVEVACVNPAMPGSSGRAPLEAYLSNSPETANAWVGGKAVAQPFVKLPGVVSGACVERDGARYLSISVDADGARKAPSFGMLAESPVFAPLWGLHMVDMHLGLGDLVALAGTQGAAYAKR